MPNGPLAHICILVRSLDQAVDDWSKILKVMDPGQLEQKLVRYDDFVGGDDDMLWATFVNPNGTEIQLMEPRPGTPLYKRLEEKGEGVHHICFTTDNPEDALERMKADGLSVDANTSQDPNMTWQRWGWVLPKSAHGTLVEVARPYKPVDGRWEDGSA